jgi:hypothetical protein
MLRVKRFKGTIMRYRLLCLILLLCLTLPLQAQDDRSPYETALQRIEEARLSGATGLELIEFGLTELPPEIGQLTNLQWLLLSENQLRDLPSEFVALQNLEVLHISFNSLETFPLEITKLNNLRHLDLSFNNLSELPPEIGQLQNLLGLGLQDNKLTTVPELHYLTNLHYLNLANNQIRHLPYQLGQLEFQTKPSNCSYCVNGLFIYGNPLISPPPEVVEQGTDAVLAYLRNQAWYHLQRLIIGIASGVGLLTVIILGVHLRRQGRKPKQKRESYASD